MGVTANDEDEREHIEGREHLYEVFSLENEDEGENEGDGD
jgi:hypothetical protein